MMKDALVAALLRVVDPAIVLRRPEELMLYEYDGSVLDQGMPEVVVAPRTTDEVAACVKVAAQLGAPIVARAPAPVWPAVRCPNRGGWSFRSRASTASSRLIQ